MGKRKSVRTKATATRQPTMAPSLHHPPPDVMEEVHAEELTKREQTRKAGLGLTKPQGNIGKASKKKDKRKQKRTNLLQKLQATELIKEKEKKAAQEQGAPLSSVSDLLSALMQRETSNSSERHKADTTARLTTHKKTKIMTSEVEQFKNVLAHPAFQRDPMAAIKEHLSNKVAFMNTSSRQQNRSNKGKGKKK
ncbi:Translation initiation factor IF-2 [Balamuthia mandrillaris]